MAKMSEKLMELAGSMAGSGQQLADEIDNTDRNGCFEYCDGWPEALREEFSGIMMTTADAIEVGTITDEETEALFQRGRDYSARSGVVHAICRKECPGAYSLFSDDEALDDLNEKPFIKPCPIKVRLSSALEQSETEQS